MAVPIVRKKPENEKVMKLEFKIITVPEFDDDGNVTAPPHWELLYGDEKLGWGPADTAQAMWRLFCILSIATRLVPVEVLEDNLRAMQAQIPTGGFEGHEN